MHIEPSRRCAMVDAFRREGVRGVWLALLEELVRLAGPDTQLLLHRERSWSSSTFSGARHSFRLAFEGVEAVAGGEALITTLADHEFAVPQRLVADATVSAVEHDLAGGPRLVVEAELLVLDE